MGANGSASRSDSATDSATRRLRLALATKRSQTFRFATLNVPLSQAPSLATSFSTNGSRVVDWSGVNLTDPGGVLPAPGATPKSLWSPSATDRVRVNLERRLA